MSTLIFPDIAQDFRTHIQQSELAKALHSLRKLVAACERGDLADTYDEIFTTYTYLLQYTLGGVNDPKRDNIYKELINKTLNLFNIVYDALNTKLSNAKYFADKRTTLRSIIKHNLNLEKIYNDISSEKDSESEQRKQALNLMFAYIQAQEFRENDLDFLEKNVRSKTLKMHEWSQITSALTISLLNRFDENKLHALYVLYDSNRPQIWQRALVGIFLANYLYDRYLQYYPKLKMRLKTLAEDEEAEKNIELIIIQLIKSKETKKISDRLQNEIMPEVSKFRPKIADKLDLDKLLSDKMTADINPDWEEVFEDAPELLNKMEEISKLQLDGSDVFMSAFSQLKNYPFFSQTANWFLPFYKENTEALTALRNGAPDFDAEQFASVMQDSAYICNSDKYSFCMNVALLPEAQRKMISGIFKMETEAMKDISTQDELINKNAKNKHLYTRYIQDLYRFIKLHVWGNENTITDIFESEFDFHNAYIYKKIIKSDQLLRNAAEFYFKKEFYIEAIEAFTQVKITENNARRIFEKIGYAYQQLQQYEQALVNYDRADLYDGNQQWLNTKRGYCYRKLSKFEQALDYYKRAEAEAPENQSIQINTANCLVNLARYEEALQYYFKLDYNEPESTKIMRPLAWCAFVAGKSETAAKYYKKLIAEKPNTYDLINYGHVLATTNMFMKAYEMYAAAVKRSTLDEILDNIREDSEYLKKNGVEPAVIETLCEFLIVQNQ